MKILITGNMGYIGSHLVPHLRQSFPSALLMGVDIGYFAPCLFGHSVPERFLNCQHMVDTRDIGEELLAGVDIVVHLASLSNSVLGDAYSGLVREINVKSSTRLAQAAKNRGAKVFVFASSCSVYGDCSVHESPSEISMPRPLNAYAQSKLAVEDVLHKMANNSFRVTCLRLATACGMSPRFRTDLVLNEFVTGALTEGKITIRSNGKVWRPLVSLGDIALAIDWAITRPHHDPVPFRVVNVGSSESTVRILDLAQIVADHIPATIDVTNEWPDKRSYIVNFQLFKDLAPDHQPRESLRSVIRQLAHTLVNYTSEKLRDRVTFSRIGMLRALVEENVLDTRLKWR